MIKLKLKRLGSMMMACALLIASVGDGGFSLPVEAATGQVILAEDNGSSTPTTLIDAFGGDSVSLKTIPSTGVKAKKPIIKKDDVELTIPNQMIDINMNTLKVTIGEGANVEGDYRVQLDLFATKNEGVVIETIPASVPGTSNPIPIAGTFTIDYNEAIDTASVLEFSCDGIVGTSYYFRPTGTPTGSFADITTITQVGSIEGGKLVLKLMNSKNQGFNATFKVNQDPLALGTTFALSFAQELTAPISIRVIDPQKMVDDKSALVPNKDEEKKLIRLENPDTLTSISNESFWLLKQDSSSKYPVDVKWYWAPYADGVNASYEQKKAVLPTATFNDRTNNLDEEGKQRIDVFPIDEAVQGYLYPVFSYQKPGGKVYTSLPPGLDVNNLPRDRVSKPLESIEITILGLGDFPRASTTNKWVNRKVENENGILFENNEVPVNINMDFYDGSKNKDKKGTEPYQFTGILFSGTQSKLCDKVVVTSSNPDAVTLIQYDIKGNPSSYDYGKDILFPTNVSGEKQVKYMIKANEPGEEGGAQTDLTFNFYKSGLDTPLATNKVHISVKDTSPNSNTKLTDLKMYAYKGSNMITTFINVLRAGGSGEIFEAFKFNPDQYKYPATGAARPQLELRNTVEEINFQPYCANYNQNIKVEVFDSRDNLMQEYTQDTVESESYTMKIPLEVSRPVKIIFTVTAEDGVTTGQYTINVVRRPPSEDASLGNIQAFESAAVDAPELPLTPKFDTKTLNYEIKDVRYGLEEILIKATPTDEGAEVTAIRTDIPEDTGKVDTKTNSRLVPLRYDISAEGVINNKTIVTVEITAENGTVSTYTITVSKVAPNTDATLDKLEVVDIDDKALAYKPSLGATIMEYELKIPYTTKEVKFKAIAKEPNANVALMQGTKMLIQKMSTDIFTKAYTVETTSAATPSYDFNFVVTAEDGITLKTYTLKIIREAPNNEAALSALALADDKGGALPIEGFDPEKMSYDVEVPYSVEGVIVTPTPKNPKSTVRVAGKVADKDGKFPVIKLSYPGATTIDIVVTAEDGVTTSTYTLTIKRSKPGTDSRLKSLVAAKIVDDKLKPLFVPDTLKYTATMVAEEKGVTITATANDPKAKITIDGKPAESGKPFGPIDLLEVQQTVEIVVVAEDGKSTTTYTITFTNDNLVVKSPNADLKSLKVQKGEMKPSFKASTTNYEVYVKEDEFDVDLFPVPADSLAKMEVFAGTLKIGDYGGNYSQSITDGENPFSIKVTSPDGKVTKDYLINVYRNEEDKMGSLKPLTVDDVNFEETGDIISVDVTKWPRIAAEVFEELKNYPEKKLVVQGNDYSLQFDAKDLNTIIPATAIYDFGMDFTSELEDAIMTEINSYSGNSESQPVLVDFNYHGELPGKATFTLSLGKQYANKKLYFHYYNEERGRIDYYGYVQTNSKGTFSVSLDRLGTFIITDDKRLIGSENKALLDTQAEGIDLGKTEDVIQNKVNPNTGVTEVPPPPIG